MSGTPRDRSPEVAREAGRFHPVGCLARTLVIRRERHHPADEPDQGTAPGASWVGSSQGVLQRPGTWDCSGVDLPARGQIEHRRRGPIDRALSLISRQTESENAVKDVEVCYDLGVHFVRRGTVAAILPRNTPLFSLRPATSEQQENSRNRSWHKSPCKH